MAFVGTKQIGQQEMEFKADGTVVYVTSSSVPEKPPVNPEPEKPEIEVPEVGIQPVPEMERQAKKKGGRRKKSSADD